MSVHLYALEVASDLKRRLDTEGLENVRRAQLELQREHVEIQRLRSWKRSKALREAENRFLVSLAAASTREQKP